MVRALIAVVEKVLGKAFKVDVRCHNWAVKVQVQSSIDKGLFEWAVEPRLLSHIYWFYVFKSLVCECGGYVVVLELYIFTGRQW